MPDNRPGVHVALSDRQWEDVVLALHRRGTAKASAIARRIQDQVDCVCYETSSRNCPVHQNAHIDGLGCGPVGSIAPADPHPPTHSPPHA